MPQASDELRARMQERFGDSIADGPPWEFLKSRGYTERGGLIKPPNPNHNITEDEGECVDFLCDEWDWAFVGSNVWASGAPERREEFLRRFKTKLLSLLGEHYDAKYVDEIAPTYWDDAGARADGPETCAEAEFSEWGEA